MTMEQDFYRPSAAPGGAPLLLSLMLAEIQASASEDEEAAFLLSIGTKLAERFPMDEMSDLDALEHHLNILFGQLQLGVGRIQIHGDALAISHRLPVPGERNDEDAWLAALPTILESAYDGWLRMLGSGPRLRTTRISLTDNMLELRHGL